MYSCNFVIIPHCKKVWPGMLFAKFGWNWFYRRRFLNFRYLVIISPWKRAGPFVWINFTQGWFVLSIIEIGWLVLERKIFKLVNLHYFVIMSPWKRAGPFIWTNLNPLHPKILCAKFGWNWPTGSVEDDFSNLSMYFHYFIHCSNLPLEEDWALHMNKFESPSPKDDLC